MMIIIHGEDRSEYCKVKKKNQGKHFFETKEQLYRIMPEGMARIEIDYFGEKRSDECIAYPENEIIPYKVKGNINYTADEFMSEIDLHKGLTKGGWFGKAKQWFNGGQGKDLLEFVKNPSTWGIVLAIIIVGPIILGMVFK